MKTDRPPAATSGATCDKAQLMENCGQAHALRTRRKRAQCPFYQLQRDADSLTTPHTQKDIFDLVSQILMVSTEKIKVYHLFLKFRS